MDLNLHHSPLTIQSVYTLSNLHRKHQVQPRSLVSVNRPSWKCRKSQTEIELYEADWWKEEIIYCVTVYSMKEYFSLRMNSWIGRAAHHMCVGSLCLLGMQLSSQDKIDEVLLSIFQLSKKITTFEYLCNTSEIFGQLCAKLDALL